MIFERLEYLVGSEGLDKLKEARVAIVGLGGVGGIAAISLARSGVGNIIICDFDTVSETNINRQIIATTKTIGLLKTDVLEQMILEINPDCKITKITDKVSSHLFSYNPEYVIDAIDDIKSKIYLITECMQRKIKFISSMGAAKKMDPSKISVVKLSKTTYDPIAKILRQHFKRDDFNVVSSTEALAIKQLGSYMPVVSTFGLYLSDYILKLILRR
jgi:tRNA A37 threonylcarbamoyladenosine dehydratase